MSWYRRDLERGLLRAERAFSLVDACRPCNAAPEQARVVSAWRSGRELAPRFEYAPLGEVEELGARLEQVAQGAAGLGPWGELYAARARELALEAELAPKVGSPGFAAAAARRFSAGGDAHAKRALAWAKRWAAASPEPDSSPGIPSDDESNPESLLCQLRRAVGEARLPFRVLTSRDLLAAAATGDGVIVVRSGARFRPWEVRRIVVHEVMGHALPRARAGREALGLYAVGSACGSDDEEGRALLLEERHGCLCPRRKAELARRHLAATAVREGADFVETVRLLRRLGSPIEEAVVIASRVHRGGGLAREIVYLVALSRVKRAFSREPELERHLERGRIGIEAARLLSELGDPPDLFRAERAA